MKKDDRVWLNAKGRTACPRMRPDRVGTIIGMGRLYKGSVNLLWDGTSHPVSFSIGFLELVPARDALPKPPPSQTPDDRP